MNDLELATVFIAAAAHDIERHVFDNSFLIKSVHQFSIRYSSNCILQNYSCNSFFKILYKPECDILKHLTQKE